MSDASQPQRAPGIVWLLGALAGFAVVAMILNSLLGGQRTDPREAVRAANRAEIEKINNDNLAKFGLLKGKSEEALAKGLAMVKSQAQTVSTVAVPGSPTQLKQAAEAAAAAKPAAAPAPAAPTPATPK